MAVSKDSKDKNLRVKLKPRDWNVFFFSKAWKCRWKSRHKFRSTIHTQTGWPYWHSIFLVFSFV